MMEIVDRAKAIQRFKSFFFKHFRLRIKNSSLLKLTAHPQI